MTDSSFERRGNAPPHVHVYDTTLRDGTQGEGISLSCEDKLRVAGKLDDLGVTFVEGGWPGSNPKDAEFFERAGRMTWKRAVLAAFGSTRRADRSPGDDENLEAMLQSGAPVCTLFGKSSKLHVEEVLRTTLERNLAMIEESVAHLVKQGRRVIYDAEHFFDGFAQDPNYALSTLEAAKRGGAEVLVLCETNGGALPWDVQRATERVLDRLDHAVGIHAHNDSGCGVANSLAAVRAGASHVQGTLLGVGERCGNANLCTIMANLELKMGVTCLPSGQLKELTRVARFFSEVANLGARRQTPFVGRSAFAHKGGVHVAAMRRVAQSYQHVEPESVGNRSRVVVSELSGRGNILSKAEEMGLEIPNDVAKAVVDHVKACEARGYSFEAAEASVVMMVYRRLPGYRPPFHVVNHRVIVGRHGDAPVHAEAMVKVDVDGHVMQTAADGDGPVEALDAGLRAAIVGRFPQVRDVQLKDYKVRILDGRDGTRSVTRVLIDSSDGHRKWSTVGASANIIEASYEALLDSMEFGLTFGHASGRRSTVPPASAR